MTARTRVFTLILLAGVVAVSSALAAGRTATFTVTSTLDGKTVLPLRIQWIAHPNIAVKQVQSVEFLIDGRLAWTEHHAAYYYGGNGEGEGNSLVTSFLTPGIHTFTVRALTVTNHTATDTVKARVIAAPAPPAKLAGTWTRIVTKADLKKGPKGPPAGRWKFTVTSVGWGWTPTDQFDVRYLPNGNVVLGPEIDTPDEPNGGFCGIDPLHTWTVTLSADDQSMQLNPTGHDNCGDRVAIMQGTWTRTG